MPESKYWVKTYASKGGVTGTLHYEQDCHLLNQSTGITRATPTQIEHYDTCDWCDPDTQNSWEEHNTDHLNSLKAAAKEGGSDV